MFVPMTAPPAEAAGAECDGVWFCVRDGAVVVVEGGVPCGGARHFLGVLDGRPCWGVDVDGDGDVDGFLDLRALHGRLGESRWAVAGRAVQLVAWDRDHRFCGRCGTSTDRVDGERARRCPACGLLAFPRLAPAVIVLVERGDECLLGRNARFPSGMWSTLAGFVEPGETVEHAVRREVLEESGVTVGPVSYFGSQPWPFPHSLMLGFVGTWEEGEPVADGVELVEADFFRFDELPDLPPKMSIARSLIDDFVRRRER